MNYEWFDDFVIRGERRLGVWGFNIVATLGLLILAAIYVRPELNYTNAGLWFEKLANHPFDFSQNNILRYRILTPLISYLLGLKGKLFMVTNGILLFIFVGMIYRYFRAKFPLPADALFATSIFTFSSVVLVTIGYSGFCDILSYLAIFSMWRWRHNIWLFSVFFAIALFNHENILFLLPWLITIRVVISDSRMKTTILTFIAMGIVIALYIFFRNWVNAHNQTGLTLSYYLQPLINDPLHWMRSPIQYYGLGLFTVFKVLWIIPVTACYFLWKEGRKQETILIVMPVVLASCQLLIAFDSTRLFTLGFMSMVLSLEYFFMAKKDWFRKFLPGLLLINLFIPQLFTASTIIQNMRSTPMNFLRMWLENKPWWP